MPNAVQATLTAGLQPQKLPYPPNCCASMQRHCVRPHGMHCAVNVLNKVQNACYGCQHCVDSKQAVAVMRYSWQMLLRHDIAAPASRAARSLVREREDRVRADTEGVLHSASATRAASSRRAVNRMRIMLTDSGSG